MYWVQSRSGDDRSFVCDFRSDIPKLPTKSRNGLDPRAGIEANQRASAGSDCLCLEDSSVWMLGKETDVWKEL